MGREPSGLAPAVSLADAPPGGALPLLLPGLSAVRDAAGAGVRRGPSPPHGGRGPSRALGRGAPRCPLVAHWSCPARLQRPAVRLDAGGILRRAQAGPASRDRGVGAREPRAARPPAGDAPPDAGAGARRGLSRDPLLARDRPPDLRPLRRLPGIPSFEPLRLLPAGEGSAMIQTAPPAEVFPEYPASWYLFGESRELRQGPVSRRILGRLLVAFRTGSGRLVVMDGECAHLGADLGFGEVVGETIRCPFHHWRYGCDGACVGVPQGRPPAFARQRIYPVEERHGYRLLFKRRRALFPPALFLDDK